MSPVLTTRRDGLPVQLGDRRWMIDHTQLTRRPKATYRTGFDTGQEAGEQSLSNEDMWRRQQRDWSLGAGQEFFDEPEVSNRRRFRASKGLDVLSDDRAIKLHKATGVRAAQTAVGQFVLATESRLWHSYGGTLRYTTNPTATTPTWTTVTGLSGNVITSVATDGAHVYVADGSTLRRVAVNASASSSFGTGTPTLLAYASGRLLGADDNELYELLADGSTKVIWTHPSSGFRWDWIKGTLNGIYAGGSSGGRSEVYLLSVVDATGDLAAPYPVLPFVTDEVIRCAEFYAGYMILGTSRGVRLCRIQGNGFLSYGPYLPVGDVRALCSRGEFIWFTWSNYDTVSTGLGRMSLKRFTEEMVPAYASDLMANGQGAVTSIASFGDRRYFTVGGVGLIGETDSYVTSGTLESGTITFGVPERKAFVSVEGRWDLIPEGAGIEVRFVCDGGVDHGGIDAGPSDYLGALHVFLGGDPSKRETEAGEVHVTLTGDGTSTPTLRRWTLRALAMVIHAEEIAVPLVLHEQVRDEGAVLHQLTLDDIAYVAQLRDSRALVPLRLGSEEHLVYVSGLVINEGDMKKWGFQQRALEGVYYAICVTATGAT